MRPPELRAQFDLLPGELVADNFAGGGGASTGIEHAIGRPCDLAINHDPEAIAVHRANHPDTKHFCENIWKVDPALACAGRPVGLAWFSPDCTHHSRARGGKPRCKKIRALAWVVTRWAKAVRPRVIFVENVEEFESWGPLDKQGHVIKSRAGETFRSWLAKLRDLGYEVQFRSVVAADYGTPTTRKRLFIIARCDGRPIVWPEPTHGEGRPEPWRSAAQIIDWSLPCPSIFERKRPLAEATRQRIARGIQRYIAQSADPFIIPLTHRGDKRVHSIGEPVRTITAAHRGELALVSSPFLVRHGHYSHKTGAGLRLGCGAGIFRGQRLTEPLSTVCATNDKHVVAAFLTKYYGTSTGSPVTQPLPTVTANNKGGGHLAEVRAFLLKYYGARGKDSAQQLKLPLHTVRSRDCFALVTVLGQPYQIVDIGLRMLQPHELFAAQGFPADYVIAPQLNGKRLTKTAQVRLVGNSVCPPVAHCLVTSNLRGAAA